MGKKYSFKNEQRKVFLILGMHRSGTSALSGLLKNAGANFGTHLLSPSFDNPKGFFENKKIIAFNERLLDQLNLNWHTPYYFSERTYENYIDINEERERINLILSEEFGSNDSIFIKDPRISNLLPIWIDLLSVNFEIKFLGIVRNPQHVFDSLSVRNQLNFVSSAKLWVSNYYSILKYTSKVRFISFENLISSPEGELKKIKAWFSLKELNDNFSFVDINKSIDINFNPKIFSSTPIFKQVEILYNNLLKAAKSKSGIPRLFKKLLSDLEFETNDFLSFDSIQSNFFSNFILTNQSNEFIHSPFPINVGKNRLIYDFKDFKDLKELKWYPTNNFAIINDIKFLDGNETDVTDLFKIRNPLIEHGKSYVLNAKSFFIFQNLESIIDAKISITIDYYALGKEAVGQINIISFEKTKWIQSQLSQFNSIKENLDSIIDSQSKEIEELSQGKEYLDKIIFETKEITKTKNGIISNLENEISEIQNVKNQQVLEMNQLSEQLTKSKLQLKDNESSISSKEEILKGLKLEIEKLKTSNDQLDLKLNSEKSLKEKYKTKLDSSQHEFDELKKEKSDLLKKIDHLIESDNSKELKSEIDQIKSKAHQIEIEKEKNKVKLEFFENEIKKLKDDLANAQLELNKLGQERENLKTDLATSREEKLSQLFKVDKLQYQLELSIQKIEEINHVRKNEEQFYEKLIAESNILLNQNDTSEKRLLESQSENQRLKKQLEKAQNESNKIQKEIDSIQEQKDQVLGKLNSQKDSKSEDLEILHGKIAKLQTELEHKKIELAYKANELKGLNSHLSNLNKDVVDVKNSLSYKLGRSLTLPARFFYDKVIYNEKKKIPITSDEVELHQDNIVELNPQITKDLSQENIDLKEKKGKILFISPHLPDFDTSSGGKRATRMLALLSDDFDVYAYTEGLKPQKYIDKLADHGVITINTNNIKQIKRRIPKFEAIIYAWYYTIFDMSGFISLYPEAKLIMDTVDVHWVREARSIGMLDHLTEENIKRNKKREIEAYKKVDVIWTVTENDKQEVLKEIPDADVRIVSNIHDNHVTDHIPSNNKNLLFFGGFKHYPNISAVKLAAEKLLPLVRQRIPEATLTIAGSSAPDEIIQLGELENVIYKGFIEENEVEDLYKNSAIAVAPLLAGAGIKGKICEAIAFGKPVVTNDIGNEGIDLINGKEAIITNSIEEMAEGIVKIFNNEFNLQEMNSLAQDKLAKLVGPTIAKENMVQTILPEVSICIVTWNRLELVQRCIQSIEGNTNYPYYKILVHSNGCEDGTQEYLKAAAKINPKIIPILSKDNDVFVKPNNAMMRMFPNNDAVLVNNDVYVTENWLQELYNAAYSDNDIGIAGSKILYPDGTLQEFGSELYEDGTGRNIGKWGNPNDDEFSQMRRVGYVSGCSMYIKKSTLDKIGVFDLEFHPCYCEDSDYCYTAWENGIQTVVTPSSVIYHDEGGTSGTDEDSGFKAYQKVNFEKFLKKHKHNLSDISKIIENLN